MLVREVLERLRPLATRLTIGEGESKKVTLKNGVLDPQGKAIEHSLSSLGFAGVEDVRAGKLFRITLADSGQTREEVESQLRQMCERLLANPVTEDYLLEVEED